MSPASVNASSQTRSGDSRSFGTHFTASSRRFHFVDLLRAFAAIAVLICHYRFFYAPSPADEGVTVALPNADWLWPFYKHGGQAVMLFWILSGFVFWSAYGAARISPGQFWVHRVARLYPLHFLTLCLMAALEWVSWQMTGSFIAYGNNDPAHFVAQLFMASNWFTQETSFNGPIWSVSIEVLVYFAFLGFVQRPSLGFAAALAVIAFVVDRYMEQPLALCAALFFAGVVIGILSPRFSMALLPMGLLGIVVTATQIAMFGSGTNAVLVYAGSASLLITFIGLDYRFTLARRWRWIGLSTYSIYLLHIPLLVVLMLTIGIVPLPVFAGLTIGLSVLSYKFIEAPAQNGIREWSRKRSPSVPG